MMVRAVTPYPPYHSQSSYYGFDSEEFQTRRLDWAWLLALGVAMIGLGGVALGAVATTTLVTTFFLGSLVLGAGMLQLFQSFYSRRWSGFFLHLVTSVLYVVVGFMMMINPVGGALSFTLLLTAFFLMSGLFRITAALTLRFPRSGWTLTSGCVALVLAFMVFAQWPASGVWLIGTLVGVDLICAGWAVVLFAWALHRAKTGSFNPDSTR
jgi:uncharacterized membrane protein HdeD (DUF308 family)